MRYILPLSVSLIFLALLSSFTSASDVLLSRNKLKLLDATSHIDIADFEQHPEINDQIPTLVEGGYGKRSIVYGTEVWYGGGYEHFYAPLGDVYPKLVLFNISDDKLDMTSRVMSAEGVGITSSTFSPAADHPFGVVISYESDTGGIVGEQSFVLEKYSYNDIGVYDQTPQTLDLSTLDPLFYNTTAAYVGNPGISDDGKYIIVSYPLGDKNKTPGLIVSQKLVVLDSNTLTPVATTNTSAVPSYLPGMFSFPQYCDMWECSEGVYNLICSDDSWNFTFNRGLNSQIAYYRFNSLDATLELVDYEYATSYIESHAVDRQRGLVYSVGLKSIPPGAATPLYFPEPRTTYENGAADPSFNLRVYRFDYDSIHYIGGTDLNAGGNGMTLSNDGTRLAVATTPGGYNHVIEPPPGSAVDNGLRYTEEMLLIYDVFSIGDFVRLSLSSSAGVAPLTYGLAFNSDGSRLAGDGETIYQPTNLTYNAGYKSTLLYSVS